MSLTAEQARELEGAQQLNRTLEAHLDEMHQILEEFSKALWAAQELLEECDARVAISRQAAIQARDSRYIRHSFESSMCALRAALAVL